MITKAALAGLTLAALALSACGGGTAGGSGSVAPAPESAASTPASSPAAPDAGASASTPGATGAGATTDPCAVLDADQVADLTGLKVKKGTSQTVSSSTLCTWYPEDGTAGDAAVVSAQEGALPGSLSEVEDQLKQQFDGTVSKIDIAGADDARYITGKKSGLRIIDVLAQHDGIFYQVLIAAPTDVSRYKAGAIKVTEALIKA